MICSVIIDFMQMTSSPRHTSMAGRGMPTGGLLLNKIEEVNKSVKVNTFSVHIKKKYLLCCFYGVGKKEIKNFTLPFLF